MGRFSGDVCSDVCSDVTHAPAGPPRWGASVVTCAVTFAVTSHTRLQACHDGVGGRDGVNDVARDPLHVKAALALDAEDVRAEECQCGVCDDVTHSQCDVTHLKTWERMLAAAVTKSSATASSLSNTASPIVLRLACVRVRVREC